MRIARAWLVAALVAACGAAVAAQAAREAVLKQIQLPHNYYYRAMYLPQLTTGPSALAFSPDGSELVYSMGGSLWRQRIGSDTATELTHAHGYDYQPDWSPDGRHVVFVRYAGDAMELHQLDLASGRDVALTANHGVNVEPRYAPDGDRIAFVSTAASGHFDLFVADVAGDTLGAPRALVVPRRSAIARYYYSAFDHAIDPSWTPDGQRVVFVSNREVAYGTGDLWSVAADGSDARRILSEETAWRAQPQVAPDGRRILFSSYHGRQWQQLWLTTLDGAAPLPLTFGAFDRTQQRFSPDGRRMGYVSNEGGNTSLWVQEVFGGARVPIIATHRRWKVPTATLRIAMHDGTGTGTVVPSRLSVVAADDRAYAPADAWMHADDGYDRALQPFEAHYFHCAGSCTLEVPVGAVRIVATRGLEHALVARTVQVGTSGATLDLAPAPLQLPERYGRWSSADLHVHMNYGGAYRATTDTLVAQARAEDLDAVYNLVVNKEERIPDIDVFSPRPVTQDGVLVLQGQEFHSSYWGHLGLLDLDDHFLTPDFSAYRLSPIASPWPHNGAVADLAHAQHGLVGYAHPFDEPVDPVKDATLTNALPADVAHGNVDYYEAVGFSDHRSTAGVWYRLLNLGFRLPAGAGTDAMTNDASLRGPVGMNRVYIATNGVTTPRALHDGLKAGRTFATNGPLLGFEVAGKRPGDTIALAGPGQLAWNAAVRSILPMQHVEVVFNGQVVATIKPDTTGPNLEATAADGEGVVSIDRSGWLLLRAWNDGADPRVLDIYPYATTSPVYVTVAGKPPRSPADAAYFVQWIDRTIADAGARTDYDDAREKADTLRYLREARAVFAGRE